MPLPSTRPIAIMTAGDFTSWGAQMCHVQNIKLRKRPCRQTLRKATAPHRPIPDDITSKKEEKQKIYIGGGRIYCAPGRATTILCIDALILEMKRDETRQDKTTGQQGVVTQTPCGRGRDHS